MMMAEKDSTVHPKIQTDDSFEDTDFIRVKWTKVTVSGPSGTGKSSALRLLLNESPVTEHLSTSVVRKLETTLLSETSKNQWEKVPNLEKILKSGDRTSNDLHFIYAVDTGGQAAFLDIAPALLRYNSVNIVTHKLDEKLGDETSFYYSVEGRRIGDPIKRQLTNLQVLESSIRSLASLKDPEQLDGIKVILKTNPSGFIEGKEIDGKPSIIVLGTFNDKIHPEESLKEKNKKLNESLSGFVMDTTILKYSENGSLIFPVNAIARGEEEKKIADAIRREVRKAYIHAEIPQRWFVFQMELNKLKSGIASKDECDKIGQKLGMSPRSVSSALLYFHNLTIILYFPKILPHVIFLDPQPLFDKLSELISVSFAKGADYFEEVRKIDLPNKAHDDLKNRGVFKEELLLAKGFMGMVYQAEDFLKLLENLQIIIQLPNTPTPVYFLPCVLPTASDLTQVKAKYEINVDPLVLRWEGRIIPQGLYCALVLRLLQENIVDINGFLDNDTTLARYRNAIEMPCNSQLSGHLLLVDSMTHLEVHYSGNVQHCYRIREATIEQLSRASRAFHYNAQLSNPEVCLWDESTKQFLKVNEEEKGYSSRQQPWLKSSKNDTKKRHWESITSVDDALSYLKDRDFNNQLWSFLGEELKLTKKDLDDIGTQFDSASRCLRACMSLWLEKKQGTGERIWRTLSIIAKKINLSKLADKADDNIKSVDEAVQFLSDRDFNFQLWSYLGEQLKMNDDIFDEIEDKFDSSFSCLRECLRLWLEEDKGNHNKTWQTLTKALDSIN